MLLKIFLLLLFSSALVLCDSVVNGNYVSRKKPTNVSIATIPSGPSIEPLLHRPPSNHLPTQLQLHKKHESNRSAAWVEGLKNSLASGLAAVVSKTLLAPFDTIKTQQQQSLLGSRNIRFFQAAHQIMNRPNGLLEFYAGLGVSAIGAMPSVGLYFGVYSLTKQTLGPWLHQILYTTSTSSSSVPIAEERAWVQTITVAVSAAIGNTVASFSRVPYEVIKQKLQTGQYSSTLLAIRGMIQECSSNPARAFFPKGGVSAQMMRDIPYAVFTLVSYETLRNFYKNKSRQNKDGRETTKKIAPWTDMMVGAIAGGIGSYLTNPMDVVKTRMQMDTDGSLYHGKLWYCVSQTYRKDGPSAFLRGSIPRLLHKVPANGAFFLFYEWFRHLLRVEEYSSK